MYDIDMRLMAGQDIEKLLNFSDIENELVLGKLYNVQYGEKHETINARVMEINYFNGTYYCCLLYPEYSNRVSHLNLQDLYEGTTYPVAVIEGELDANFRVINFNEEFSGLFSEAKEDLLYDFNENKINIIKRDSKWTHNIRFRTSKDILDREMKVDILEITANHRRRSILLLTPNHSINYKMNRLQDIIKDYPELEDETIKGHLVKIVFYIDKKNYHLSEQVLSIGRGLMNDYFESLGVDVSTHISMGSLYIFARTRISYLSDLVNILLRNPEIERYEFRNECKVNVRICISSKDRLNIQLVNEVYELFGLYEDHEYDLILFNHKKDQYRRKKEIHLGIRQALKENHFKLYAQSIVNTVEATIESFEILIRWQHPTYGVIEPMEFIPYAERSGDIVHIDNFVIDRTFRYLRDNEELFKDFEIHVNLSNRTLHSKQFINFATSPRHNQYKHKIVFELTEDQSLIGMDNIINKLRRDGYQLAIDDFGKGYSSFERIRDIGIEYIKIDKSLIDRLTFNVDDMLILEAIITMCNNLKIKVIAEGIEQIEQLEFLYARRCDRIQGFIFSEPVPLMEAVENLDDVQEKVTHIVQQLGNDDIASKKFYNKGRVINQDIDSDFNLITPNASLGDMLGYEYKYFASMTFLDLLPVQMVKSFRSFVEAFEADRIQKAIMLELKTYDRKHLKGICVLQAKHEENTYKLYIEFQDDNNEFELLGLSNSYLQAFEEAPSGMMIISSNFTIKRWNHSCTKIFGYTLQEALNENIIKLLSAENKLDDMTQMLQSALKNGLIERVIDIRHKDDTKRTIRWHVDTLFDELLQVQQYICIANDITDELKRNEELYKINQALEQSESIIFMTDKEGKFEYVNQKFQEITGYSSKDVMGKSTNILSSGEKARGYYQKLWATISSGEAWFGELHNVKKNGEFYWCRETIYPVRQGNRITGYVGIQVDISHEKELENLNSSLKQKLYEQDKVASIGLMSSGIVHEINNPLSFIHGNIKFMLDLLSDVNALDEDDFVDLIEALQDVDKGVEQIKTIASSLKKYIFKGNEDEKEIVNLVEEIQTILVISKNEYKYHATVQFDYNEGVDYKIQGFASKLKQVFMNLVINAAHAIGSLERENLGLIHIELINAKKQVIVKVSDNGCGMTPETIERIFEPFYTTKGEGVGSGLGLSLVRHIIEDDHQGTILCDSEPGHGTTFTLKLPIID